MPICERYSDVKNNLTQRSGIEMAILRFSKYLAKLLEFAR